MKNALTGVAALSILTALTGCVPAVEEVSTQFTEINANQTTSSFLNQVKSDTASYVAQYSSTMTKEAQQALHEQAFSQSLSYVDPSSVTEEGIDKLMDELSMLYLTEPEAEIKTYEGDFKLADNTAMISSDEFEVMIDGKRKAALTPAPLTLKLTDEGWKIAGYGS